ncbi:MAG: tRNA-uridine aminocarboxypropyltransferase [Chitinispirillaceae bacterium]|jgi:DTW domain-containing protein YfiP
MQKEFIVTDTRAKQKFDRNTVCQRCYRPHEACFCDTITPLDNRIKIVILQHPQEQYKALNSARLCHCLLRNSRIFVGLSWSNFKKVAGPDALPSEWGVLFLKPDHHEGNRPLSVINRKKEPVGTASFLRGIVVLDGSWKQAKALWWRNPWLLKLNRISLNPGHASLRPQVKQEGLSTIEAIAFALEHLGDNAEIPSQLRTKYQELILQGKPASGVIVPT